MKKRIRASEILTAVRSRTASDRLAIPALAPEDTGLPMAVCLTIRDTDHYEPRIKVSRDHGPRLNMDRLVTVSVSNDPRLVGGAGLSNQDLDLVRAWVLLNKGTLLRYWSSSLSTADMMAGLRPLGQPRGRK